MRCIDSVLVQTHADWEMILVDDGSPDSSPCLCDEAARKDTRIKVIHQANKGLGAARNSGIERAVGDYLLFVDSDDYIAPNTIEVALEALKKHTESDFVEFGVHKWVGNKQLETTLSFKPYVCNTALDYWFAMRGYEHCYACNKMFRRSVFERIKFQEDKKFEDVFTMNKLLTQWKQCVFIPQVLYYYCYNKQSITSTSSTALSDLLEALVQVFAALEWRKPKGVSRRDYAHFCSHALNVQIDVYARCGRQKLLLRTLPLAFTPKMIGQRFLGISLFCKVYNKLREICKITR